MPRQKSIPFLTFRLKIQKRRRDENGNLANPRLNGLYAIHVSKLLKFDSKTGRKRDHLVNDVIFSVLGHVTQNLLGTTGNKSGKVV